MTGLRRGVGWPRRGAARLRRGVGWLRAQTGTVRVRTTGAAALVLTVALAAGAALLVGAVGTTLTREVRAAAQLRAAEVAADLTSGGGARELAVEGTDEVLIQVLDTTGTVVAASANAAGLPPVARLTPGQSAEVRAPLDDDRFLAVAAAAETAQGRRVVVVARSMDTVGESTRVLGTLLAIGLPILLVVVVATTWHVVGRALAPVEAVRREVDEISAAELHRRVPDPPGDDEVSRLSRTMNRMLDRLEQARRRQQRFLSDASHELRSPVATIRQHAEVAHAHPDRIGTADLAGTVLAESTRLQRLVEDMLLLTRADEHAIRLRHGPVDLDDLVLDEARRLRATTALRVRTADLTAGRVHGDDAGLRRVLRNLGDNAARYARTQIAFALAEHDDTVELTIDDDGPGIPIADRGRVLDRFVRLDDARTRDTGGSGLGLAIVYELVTAHRGTVTVTESPLGGARIHLAFPRHGPPSP